jgi:glycosyltransferase involved in cell wall biosynthesis
LKLACVIHRYGADVAGGSEAHCRGIAERLAASHDVTVLTTCARDHLSWRNEYPAGVVKGGGVTVRRFPVAHPRSLARFADISEIVFAGDATEADQEQWFRENGPEAPELLAYLSAHGSDYDRILFWSFRYAHSFFGLPLVGDRAILVPTAEDDPVMRLDVLERFFAMPAGFVFLTPEEQRLVERRAARPIGPSCIVGTGLEPPPAHVGSGAASRLMARGISAPFALYLGRIDPNKGCETLVRYFIDAQTSLARPPTLVMAGPAIMTIPAHSSIVTLGFVDEATREALLAEATVLIMPSPYESLSMVLLEAWNHSRPALVNGRCAVLKGQALRSNGALYYRRVDEFTEGLRRLVDDADLAREMGQNGRAYVDREYRWPHVTETLETFLSGLA